MADATVCATLFGVSQQYITTAIDYPNAAPHMGHVLEKIIADVMARWFRLRGDDVRFQIGTDEHGIKIQQTAKKQGVTPEELVDKNVPLFEDLYRKMNISADVFIRTSDRAVSWNYASKIEHKKTVAELWKKLVDAGMLEKRSYTGLYCSGCERFITKKDLVDGKCPDHGIAPEEVVEENWFFKLSQETAWLKKLLPKEYEIVPDYRAEETMALLERGLEDVSFSRPRSSLSWGVPVPGDEDQTMYVWCDALTNYISGVDYFDLAGSKAKSYWDDAEVTHVIGKDIARFHALIWPAMLKTAGIRTPDRLLIHGFVTSEGQKMSKSLGNVVNPVDVLEKFKGNPDPMRFFLLHEIPVGGDGDFSWKRLEEMYDAKLRNQLGNLLNRILVLLRKAGGNVVIEMDETDTKFMPEDWKLYEEAMNDFKPHLALQLQISGLLTFGNGYMESMKPWGMEPDKAAVVLGHIAEKLRHASLMLLPFLPDTAYRISKQLNVPYAEKMLHRDFVITDEMKQWGGMKEWKTVGEPEILFAPLED